VPLCCCACRNYEDVYSDPGAPLARRTKWGTYVLAKLEGKRQLLMEGTGASEEGNKPFLSVLDLDTKETKQLWQSGPSFFETPGSILNDTDYVSALDPGCCARALLELVTC